MCALCGVFGSKGDWLDAPATVMSAERATHRAQRSQRVRIANKALAPFGLVLSDWEGASYQLASRTGRTELADNLAQVWQAAERMLGRACDPLDPALLARIEQIDMD
jgi:hypothetical protein